MESATSRINHRDNLRGQVMEETTKAKMFVSIFSMKSISSVSYTAMINTVLALKGWKLSKKHENDPAGFLAAFWGVRRDIAVIAIETVKYPSSLTLLTPDDHHLTERAIYYILKDWLSRKPRSLHVPVTIQELNEEMDAYAAFPAATIRGKERWFVELAKVIVVNMLVHYCLRETEEVALQFSHDAVEVFLTNIKKKLHDKMLRDALSEEVAKGGLTLDESETLLERYNFNA